MRLYDQQSGTPIKLNGRKWVRPNNFLPSQSESVAEELPNFFVEKVSPVAGTIKTTSTGNGSETSSSTAIDFSQVKNHVIYDDFRFDIDEDQELSLTSSSTLSTHSTFGYVNHDLHGRLGKTLSKRISEIKHGEHESYPECTCNGPYHRVMNSKAYVVAEPEIVANGYLLRDVHKCSRFDDNIKLNPTKSLGSDSRWIEFKGFGSQPSRTPGDKNRSSQQKQSCEATLLDSQCFDTQNPLKHESEVSVQSDFGVDDRMVRRHMDMNDGTKNYTKYYKMFMGGISIDEVLQNMKNDFVDPTIISLVLAASKSSERS